MDTLDPDTRRRLDELMPWFVNGRIDPADRAWVERVLAESPAARDQLAWHNHLHQRIRAQFQDVPELVGLDRLMARVRADAEETPAAPVRSWLERLREQFAGFAARPAFALAMALIVVQAGFIGALLPRVWDEPEYSATRSLGPSEALADAPVLQVMFKADTTERDMRMLLVNIAGRVIDGPGQLGEFIVLVPAGRIEDARRQLEASGLVDQVTVLERRPQRD